MPSSAISSMAVPSAAASSAAPFATPSAAPSAAPSGEVVSGNKAPICTDYEPAIFEDDGGSSCPPQGTIICGSNTSRPTRTGDLVKYPYQTGTQTCSSGCTCEAHTKRVYSSCEGEFVYVGHCDAVYTVDSTSGAQALRGKRFEWSESTFGEQIVVGTATVTSGRSVDRRFVQSTPFDWTAYGESYRTRGASEQCVGDDSTFSLSIPGGATFRFAGGTFSVMYVSSNGYLCFDEEALVSGASSGLLADHFGADKGRCFSFLFADLAPDSVHICHTDKRRVGADNAISWAPHATYFTIEDAPLQGDEASGTTNTIQVELNYETNSIAVTYGSVSPAITAVIGPSEGSGLREDFVPRELLSPERYGN